MPSNKREGTRGAFSATRELDYVIKTIGASISTGIAASIAAPCTGIKSEILVMSSLQQGRRKEGSERGSAVQESHAGTPCFENKAAFTGSL